MVAPQTPKPRRDKLSYTVEPGGLSDAHHARIFEMAERGLKSGPIARAILKHPATVRWFMFRNGLAKVAVRHAMPTDKPNARGRKGYTAAEDAFIVALRADGVDLRVIAARATAEFGHPRSRHGIEVRLVMLASSDEAEAA